MNDKVILKVQGLTKVFGGVKAVDDVSFELKEGDTVGLIGPNGSGKTTTINLITGFVKPTSGKVFFKDVELTKMKPHQIVDAGVVRTFQVMRPYQTLPAYKNLIVPLYSPRVRRFQGGKSGDRDAIAIDLLEEMGFERDAYVPYKLASALPLGYLKRLELARCLALKPEVILCDEVFSGLSMAEIATVVPLIQHLVDEGITVLMIEHRLRELFKIVNKVIVLNFGKKLAEGPPDEVMEVKEVRDAYMGTQEVHV